MGRRDLKYLHPLIRSFKSDLSCLCERTLWRSWIWMVNYISLISSLLIVLYQAARKEGEGDVKSFNSNLFSPKHFSDI